MLLVDMATVPKGSVNFDFSQKEWLGHSQVTKTSVRVIKQTEKE